MTIRAVGEGVEFKMGTLHAQPHLVEMSKEKFIEELTTLADHIFNGGQVGLHGPINEVLGLRCMMVFTMAVDAPDETWAKMKDIEDEERKKEETRKVEAKANARGARLRAHNSGVPRGTGH